MMTVEELVDQVCEGKHPEDVLEALSARKGVRKNEVLSMIDSLKDIEQKLDEAVREAGQLKQFVDSTNDPQFGVALSDVSSKLAEVQKQAGGIDFRQAHQHLQSILQQLRSSP